MLIALDKARPILGELANRCSLLGEKVTLTRNGKPIATIGPAEISTALKKSR